jgi:hypothetical protein
MLPAMVTRRPAEGGHVGYPYTGFSGDPCMSDDWYLAHCDIYRADDEGDVRTVDGVKTTWWRNKTILAGMGVPCCARACNAVGIRN